MGKKENGKEKDLTHLVSPVAMIIYIHPIGTWAI